MMDLEFLQSLIRALDESGLDSLEIERGGTRIRLSRTPPMAPLAAAPAVALQGGGVAAPASPPPGGAPAEPPPEAGGAESSTESGEAASSSLLEVTSPMVGTFYRAPAPDAPPYVEVGDRVARGDTLCIIEAMKLMNELEAEVSGTLAEVCVENAEPVEYGQVLFRVEPS